MQQHAMSDGISSYGFPLTFYSYSGGKLDRQNTQLGFQPINLILDVCIAFVSVFLFRKTIKKR
jgi:hypothetical protein